jgi:hypothetical protein
MIHEQQRLIDLRSSIDGRVKRALFRLVELPVDKALAVAGVTASTPRRCRCRCALATRRPATSRPGLATAGVRSGRRGPAEDPGHRAAGGGGEPPFGAVEGLVLGDLLTRVRHDVRILGNHLLQEIPRLRASIIPSTCRAERARPPRTPPR